MNGDTTVIINTLTQVIGSLGFPIVMCFLHDETEP